MSRRKPKESAAAKNATNNDVRRPREHLKTPVLEELWSIWQADPRVPSVRSRHTWAISRNAIPRLVDCWFLRRRAQAKRAGEPISEDAYDLPLEPPILPKREPTTPVKLEFDAFPDLPSDDTLAYPPDIDYSDDVDASSDTVFDEDMPVDSKKPDLPAYTEVSQKIHLEYYQKQSSANFDTDKDTLLIENAPFPICNQGERKLSSFTCALCSRGAQGKPDVAPSGSSTMSDPFTTFYDYLGFPPVTLLELSAIPFLFRTPPTVLSNSTQYVDDWTIVEEELSRLVRDGRLDFSFLDAPHLTFMDVSD